MQASASDKYQENILKSQTQLVRKILLQVLSQPICGYFTLQVVLMNHRYLLKSKVFSSECLELGTQCSFQARNSRIQFYRLNNTEFKYAIRLITHVVFYNIYYKLCKPLRKRVFYKCVNIQKNISSLLPLKNCPSNSVQETLSRHDFH